MMSQVTNGIFATPGQIAPLPTARPSRTPSSSTKLVVTDADGQVLQSWVLKQPKCTLGSADSCTIACSLPGIAPVHALIVTGARQTFVRSLAGKLSQDGIPVSELLLSDNKSYFELAGYRFSLLRKAPTESREEQVQAQRMRFALARPLAISNPTEIAKDIQPEEKSLSAPWVANVIREAIEPLEAQIDSLLLPLAEFQAQSLQAQISAARELEEEKRKTQEKARNAKEVEIVNMVAQQSANMETLTERISDVNTQLSTIERIIAQDAELNANAKIEANKIVSVQQTAIEQLQVGMVSVSESIKLLQEQQRAAQNDNQNWKNELQLQLQQLTSAVSEFSDIAKNNQQPELLEAIESLKQTHEVAQSEIQRWQHGVQKQLDVLQVKMQENAETAREQVPAQIAEAITEIQSKHEQTLAELQSWKSELRQEMQELLQSAFDSRAQLPVAPQSSLSYAAPPAVNSLTPLPLSQPESLPLSNSGLAVVAPVQGELYAPEIVSDEMVRSTNEQLNQSNLLNAPVPVSEAWPTLQVASDYTLVAESAPAFGNQWSSAPSSEVLENQSFHEPVSNSEPVSNEEMPWRLPNVQQQNQESQSYANQNYAEQNYAEQNYTAQRNFAPHPVELAPQADSQADANTAPSVEHAVSESQSFFVPTSESSERVENYASSSPDLSMSNLFPNADWNNEIEQPIAQLPTTEHQSLPPIQAVEQLAIDYSTFPQGAANDVVDNSGDSRITDQYNGNVETGNFVQAIPAAFAANAEVEPKQPSRNNSALPSWWTETNDEEVEESAVNTGSNQVQQESIPASLNATDEPQVDLSHLYRDPSPSQEDVPVSSAPQANQNSQNSNGQSFFGLGLETFESVNDVAPSAPIQNGHSFDRFMQREQALEGFQDAQQSEAPVAYEWQNNYPSEPEKPTDKLEAESVGLSAFDRFAAEESVDKGESVKPSDPELVGMSELDNATAFDSFTPNGQASGQAPEYQFPATKPAESYTQASAYQPAANTSRGGTHGATSGDDEEESVEAYMKNLLARMRGDSVETPVSAPAPAPAPVAPVKQSPYELRQAMRVQPDEGELVEPMDLDSYVPLASAPEKGKNISALRDLANSTARTAIHKSTRRKTLSGSLMKFAISAIAMTVAAALFAINGVAVNIALVATMAALFVAMIWGYDGIKSLKPLLQNSLVLQPTTIEPDEELDEEQ